MKFRKLFPGRKPLIGMIHLPPLPGYPTHPGMKAVIRKALKDLETLEIAGFDGALVENDNDQPHQIGVSDQIKEAFEEVMIQLIKQSKIPVGMEIIYDMQATLEVASKVGAKFVRFDVFVDNLETRWGKIPAQANRITALKQKLGIKDILLLTDIQVKHAKMLKNKSLEQSAIEAINNGSNALIVTGDWTGIAPAAEECAAVKKVSGDIPVLIGSGLDKKNSAHLLDIADGAIVGTSIKTDGFINIDKAKELKKVVLS